MILMTKLKKEEIDYLIDVFGIENVRKYFQKYPLLYQQLSTFRPKSLTTDQIRTIIQNNLNSEFIINFMHKNAEWHIKQLEENVSKVEEELGDGIKALIIALAASPFKDNIALYYKLIEKKIDDEYIQLLTLLVNTPEVIIELSGTKENTDLSERIDELTKEIEEKEKEIKDERENSEQKQSEAKQLYDVISQKLDDANEMIEKLQSELEEFKVAENKHEEAIDDGFEYHSLCEVFYDYNGEKWLSRMADIKDNIVNPFEIDEMQPKLFGNRNKLFHKNGPDTAGTIGVWAWNADENWNDSSKDYIVSSYCYNINVIMIVEVPGIQTISDWLEALKNGISITTESEKMLFTVKKNETSYSGLLCSKKDFDIQKGKYKLNEGCYSVDVYTFIGDDIIELSGKKFYKYLKMRGIPQHIKLYDPIKIVTDIILKRASWNAMKQKGVSKSTWKQCRDYISELPQEDLYKEISDACKCTEDEGKQYVADLIDNAEKYINNDNVENEILASIIPKHPEIGERYKELIYQEWKEENEEKVADANKALHDIESEVEKKNVELKRIKKQRDMLSDELSDISNNIVSKNKLASDVDELVKNKIEDAKKNAAEFISQMAFVSSVSTVAPNTSHTCFTSGDIIVSEGIEEYDSINSLHDLISEELQNSGVSRENRDSLAAYMLSAYLTHTPVLLAGPCGKSIANAFSAALCARMAGVMNCSFAFDAEVLKNIVNSKDSVVVIENPFSSEWIYSVMELISTSDKFFILVTPFVEDLSIEPKGLLNYILPVFTELLVDSSPTNDFAGSKPSDKFKIPDATKPKNKPYDKLLKIMKVSSFAINRIQMIIEQAASIYDINAGTDLLQLLLPCAYITQSEEILSADIHDQKDSWSNMSREQLRLAELYLGESDE